jgi:hypothetical protein
MVIGRRGATAAIRAAMTVCVNARSLFPLLLHTVVKLVRLTAVKWMRNNATPMLTVRLIAAAAGHHGQHRAVQVVMAV